MKRRDNNYKTSSFIVAVALVLVTLEVCNRKVTGSHEWVPSLPCHSFFTHDDLCHNQYVVPYYHCFHSGTSFDYIPICSHIWISHG
ncbi:hypothetical protein Pmani_019834 [Petrolisthes manimaculis]|uniref:Uncharacterized protein n=1 Tax=Petrolisthes manimaculis TaxID=1843537 RepID=A0AAE1U566_9EUCA|nr:hypothetical protein Pmani_019834 [Petrolisthes manimaculis]